MLQDFQTIFRKMKIKSSRGNEYYDVDLENLSCTCDDYKFRKSKTGEFCKHIKEALKVIERKK